MTKNKPTIINEKEAQTVMIRIAELLSLNMVMIEWEEEAWTMFQPLKTSPLAAAQAANLSKTQP